MGGCVCARWAAACTAPRLYGGSSSSCATCDMSALCMLALLAGLPPAPPCGLCGDSAAAAPCRLISWAVVCELNSPAADTAAHRSTVVSCQQQSFACMHPSASKSYAQAGCLDKGCQVHRARANLHDAAHERIAPVQARHCWAAVGWRCVCDFHLVQLRSHRCDGRRQAALLLLCHAAHCQPLGCCRSCLPGRACLIPPVAAAEPLVKDQAVSRRGSA